VKAVWVKFMMKIILIFAGHGFAGAERLEAASHSVREP
jgi:hypothetical protein